jgi:hypothetical protein
MQYGCAAVSASSIAAALFALGLEPVDHVAERQE